MNQINNELIEEAEGLLGAKINSGVKLRAALVTMGSFDTVIKAADAHLKAIKVLREELAEACSKYALKHETVFDEALTTLPCGTRTGTITVDDRVYAFKSGLGKVVRSNPGDQLTQAFLRTLPKYLVKEMLELNVTGVKLAILENLGMTRKIINEWKVK